MTKLDVADVGTEELTLAEAKKIHNVHSCIKYPLTGNVSDILVFWKQHVSVNSKQT